MKFFPFWLILCLLPLIAAEPTLQQAVAKKRALLEKEKKELLSNQRQLESYSHKKRIAILEKAERCIHAAKTMQQYNACEKQEKAERDAFKQELEGKKKSKQQKK